MNRGTPVQALAVVTAVVVVCATLVSAAVVVLRPVQADNRLLREASVVMQLLAAEPVPESADDRLILQRFRSLDARVVNLDTGHFETGMDPYALNVGRAANDPERSTVVPPEEDWARLGRRDRLTTVYLLWDQDELNRMVLPVHGMGMWSMIRGYVLLESDLNTIAGVTFHEQAETPGLGDRITRPDWLEKWRGRKIYDDAGVPQFAVGAGRVAPGSASELHNVDALTGATVTADAITDMIRFWFGPWGYQSLLQRLDEQPPQPPGENRAAP